MSLVSFFFVRRGSPRGAAVLPQGPAARQCPKKVESMTDVAGSGTLGNDLEEKVISDAGKSLLTPKESYHVCHLFNRKVDNV